jgi:hypothetical protein
LNLRLLQKGISAGDEKCLTQFSFLLLLLPLPLSGVMPPGVLTPLT